jgi:hypothetical protein
MLIDIQMIKNFNTNILVKKKRKWGGGLKLKFVFCFMVKTLRRCTWSDWYSWYILAQQKVMAIPTSFIWIIILFDKAFKYGDG